ncbi:MAG TPA: hypothetical protein VLG16_06005 [Candidatus Saccharimonadales bacterium]|nr:hypothetical protein [Candidatus Saccharimonadales bacterium]
MGYISPYDQAKVLEQQITMIISAIDADAAPIDARILLAKLRRYTTDTRLDVRDHDYADTRAEQVRLGQEAKKRLEQLEKLVVAASEYNIFSAADVAQISATAQLLAAQL